MLSGAYVPSGKVLAAFMAAPVVRVNAKARQAGVQRTAALLTPPAGVIWRSYYYAGAARIALREADNQNSEVYYILTDHLGSTSLTYRQSDGRIDQQWYAPWGTVRQRTGELPTDRTFQGQRDHTYINMLWYGSRWYDPVLGRFNQPDVIIPGVGEGGNPNAVGCLGAANYSPLTGDYHENQFLEQLNRENRAKLQDPDFRLPPVPTNSIVFDRYANSLNNPIRYTDPTGHCPLCAVIALTLGAVTPLGWVVIGVATVATVAFVATGGPEALGATLYQAGNAASTSLQTLFARPKSNQAQNKQFEGAVKELEKQLGRKLSKDEIQQLHEALHDLEDPGFWDIVDQGHKEFDKEEEDDGGGD